MSGRKRSSASTVSSRRRKLVRTPRFERELRENLGTSTRAAEALAGLERVIERMPELGMAVTGQPDFYCRPFHTEEGSFLVIYTFDEEKVVCLSLRRVPSGRF